MDKLSKNGNFDGIMAALMKGMDSFMTTKTVVGEPTQIGDTIIVPLVDVSFGVGVSAGTSDKKDSGLGGIGGKITPSAVLVISNGTTRLVSVKNTDSVTKVLDMVPDLVNKFTAKEPEEVSNEQAVETAFPEK